MVKVTPITEDKSPVVPSIEIPAVKLGSYKKYPIAPTLAAIRLPLRAWRPGSIRGAEFNTPCNFP